MKIKSMMALVLMALVMNLSAQVGIQAGYVSSTNVNDAPIVGVVKTDYNGFNFGPVGEFNIVQNLDLRYGFLYSLLLKHTDNGISGTIDYSGHFVDLPVQAQYSFPLTNDLKVFAFGGPTLNFGIAQNSVLKVGGSSTTTDLYEANDDLTRFDVKLGLGGGLRFSSFELRVGYDWGMLDLNKKDNITLNRNQLTAALVYHL